MKPPVDIVGETSFSPRRDSANDHFTLSVRLAEASDKAALRTAVVELHEAARGFHDSHLPGEETADAYLAWMLAAAAHDGAVFVAEAGGVFAGFAAGWVVQEQYIEETPDSNRFGYISDVCVLPAFRGRRIAARLLEALELRLSLNGIKRIRLSALAANKAARTSYERLGYAAYQIVYEKAARDPDVPSAASAAQRASER